MTDQQPTTPLPDHKADPFIDPRDLPKVTLADGTEVKVSYRFVRMKKSRLGRRYNGKHHD